MQPLLRTLPLVLLAWAACTCGPPRGTELVAEHQLQPGLRAPSAELWALGPPGARAALVVSDLRPLWRVLDDLRELAASAPRGKAALDHLDLSLRAACPACPRRSSELEAKGVGAAEGIALFLGPGSERVLALGSLRAEATLGMLESWLRRSDRSLRRSSVVWRGHRLSVIEGRSPWYCRQLGARLTCGSSPQVLDAAIARKPAQGLFEQRIAPRFKAVKRKEPGAILYLQAPLAPEVVTLAVHAGELRLRGYARARDDLEAGPAKLLGLVEGADGVLHLRLPLAALARRGGALPEELRATLRRAGIDGNALVQGLTGEVLAFKRGPFDLSLAFGIADPERIRLQLRVIHRALQLVRFTQRFRGASGPVELVELSNQDQEGGSVLTIGLKVALQELLPLPLPLTIEPRLYVALGDDCLLLGTDREVVGRALRPGARRADAIHRDVDRRQLRRVFGEHAILSFWSRALDPLSGVPAPLADRLIDDALGTEHRDLRDALETGRYLADLIHDLSFWTGKEQGLQVSELLLRPLHVDDDAHRRARPIYLRALAARHLGRREAYRKALAEVVASSGGTRYEERARMLAAGDPLTLCAALGATLAATGARLWAGVRDWLQPGPPPRPPR